MHGNGAVRLHQRVAKFTFDTNIIDIEKNNMQKNGGFSNDRNYRSNG